MLLALRTAFNTMNGDGDHFQSLNIQTLSSNLRFKRNVLSAVQNELWTF